MKKFKSKLDTVLKIRKLAVDREIKNLSIVVGNMNKLQNEINDNLKAIHLSTVNYSSTDIKKLRLYENYIKGLTLQNENLNVKLKEQVSVLDKARERVLEVEKDMKVIEAIRERQYADFKNRIIQQERLEEEEINNRIHIEKIQELEHETSQIIPKVIKKKPKRFKSDKKEPKTEFDKLMEYVESQKPKR